MGVTFSGNFTKYKAYKVKHHHRDKTILIERKRIVGADVRKPMSVLLKFKEKLV
jgi:hypothetical protein